MFTAWKVRWGLLAELLWFCNAASLALIPALWFDRPAWAGMVLLLRLALGEPGHFYAFAVTRDVEWVSVAANLPPLLAAAWYLRGRAFPRASLFLALGFVAGTLLAARLFTPPDLNVNLVFRRHGLLVRSFPGLWSYRVAAALIITGCLGLGQFLLSRWLSPAPRAQGWKEVHP
ncbi:MAG TPA: hypothetical protein VJ623_00545 [Holophagaceae bacterium]|nr:hypothetical protein [Holophagaceae bacterium]